MKAANSNIVTILPGMQQSSTGAPYLIGKETDIHGNNIRTFMVNPETMQEIREEIKGTDIAVRVSYTGGHIWFFSIFGIKPQVRHCGRPACIICSNVNQFEVVN